MIAFSRIVANKILYLCTRLILSLQVYKRRLEEFFVSTFRIYHLLSWRNTFGSGIIGCTLELSSQPEKKNMTGNSMFEAFKGLLLKIYAEVGQDGLHLKYRKVIQELLWYNVQRATIGSR